MFRSCEALHRNERICLTNAASGWWRALPNPIKKNRAPICARVGAMLNSAAKGTIPLGVPCPYPGALSDRIAPRERIAAAFTAPQPRVGGNDMAQLGNWPCVENFIPHVGDLGLPSGSVANLIGNAVSADPLDG